MDKAKKPASVDEIAKKAPATPKADLPDVVYLGETVYNPAQGGGFVMQDPQERDDPKAWVMEVKPGVYQLDGVQYTLDGDQLI